MGEWWGDWNQPSANKGGTGIPLGLKMNQTSLHARPLSGCGFWECAEQERGPFDGEECSVPGSTFSVEELVCSLVNRGRSLAPAHNAWDSWKAFEGLLRIGRANGRQSQERAQLEVGFGCHERSSLSQLVTESLGNAAKTS